MRVIINPGGTNPPKKKGRSLVVLQQSKKGRVTHAREFARPPGEWRHPPRRIRGGKREGIEVGKTALEDEEPEAKQELRCGTAHNAEGVPQGRRLLPVRATIMRGRVLGLDDNEPSVLYQAIIGGGRKEGLFLEVNSNADSIPPLQE